jgi:hypothetical protein
MNPNAPSIYRVDSGFIFEFLNFLIGIIGGEGPLLHFIEKMLCITKEENDKLYVHLSIHSVITY